jgi:hypothetical protein
MKVFPLTFSGNTFYSEIEFLLPQRFLLMLSSRSFIISILLLAAISDIYYRSLSTNANYQTLTLATNHYMSNQTIDLIKSITLIAREEKLPPLGVPQQPNRDVGFASVFVRLQNPQAKEVIFLIKKIEIYSAYTSKIIMANEQPQEIRLHPLENSENAFYIKNKTGYEGQNKVKAVITYEVDSQTHTIESESVEVEVL